jgi:acyl-coenzyme A thioesterase PaaI-like protein
MVFLRPIRPREAFAHEDVVHRVGDTAYLEASLSEANGALVAQATATALVIPLDRHAPRPERTGPAAYRPKG